MSISPTIENFTREMPAYQDLITETAGRVLTETDLNHLILVDSGSAQTMTIPADSTENLPNGFTVALCRYGSGTLSVAGEAGVTVNSRGGLLDVWNQYGTVSATKVGADEWLLVGELA